MAEKLPKNKVNGSGNVGAGNNRSNTVRSIVFMLLMACLVALVISNMNKGNTSKTEVPISEVIRVVHGENPAKARSAHNLFGDADHKER